MEEKRAMTVKRKWTEEDSIMIRTGVVFMLVPTSQHFEMNNEDVAEVSNEAYEQQTLGGSYT